MRLALLALALPAHAEPRLLFAFGFEGIQTGEMSDGYLPLTGAIALPAIAGPSAFSGPLKARCILLMTISAKPSIAGLLR